MDYQIHRVATNGWETILIKHGIAFLSFKPMSTIEEFEKEIKNTSSLNKIEAFPTSNITTIKYSDKSELVKITYLNKENESEKVTLKMGYQDIAKQFSDDLGVQLNLIKSTSIKKNWKNIFKNFIYLLITAALTVFVFFISNNPEINSTFGKSVAAIFLLISTYSFVHRISTPVKLTTHTKPPQELEETLKLKLPLLRSSD